MRRTATTNPLHWLPFPVDRWLGEIGGGLRPDQKGALMDLLATAWGQTPPCTLQNDQTYLAAKSGLGSSWKRLSPPIMRHFTPTADGRLTCVWLKNIFDVQLEKFGNRSRAGKDNRDKRTADQIKFTGDEPHANGGSDGGTNGDTDRSTNGSGGPTNGAAVGPVEGRGGSSTAPSEQVEDTTVLDGKSAAPTVPAPPGAHGRQSAEPEDPYRDPPQDPQLVKAYSEELEVEAEYRADLIEHAEKFRQRHEQVYEEHRIAAIRQFGYYRRQLTPEMERSIEWATAVRLRDAKGWSTRAQWLEKRRIAEVTTRREGAAV